jgi:hypothetical protein
MTRTVSTVFGCASWGSCVVARRGAETASAIDTKPLRNNAMRRLKQP